MIRAFRWAVAFLTVVPLAPRGAPRGHEQARSAGFFPLVGAGVGLACYGVDLVCTDVFPDLLRGLAVVMTGAVITRGLHLDGLSDTVDGLGSLRDRAGTLEVMRDPHIGAFGVIALVIVVLSQATCIAETPPDVRRGAIIVSAVSSRLAMTVACRLFPYARESGTGSSFIGRVPTWAALLGCGLAAGCAWAAGRTDGLLTLGVGTAAGLVISASVALKLRGITGDVVGASGELAQTSALVWAVTRAAN